MHDSARCKWTPQAFTGGSSGSLVDISIDALLVVQASPGSAQEYVPGCLLRAFAASLETHRPAQTPQLAPDSGPLSPLAQQPVLCDGKDPDGSHHRPVPHKQHDVASSGLLPSQAVAPAASAAADVAAEVPAAAAVNALAREMGIPADDSQLLYHSTGRSEEGVARSYDGSWTSSYNSSSMDAGSSWVTCLDPDCDGSHTSWHSSTSLGFNRTPRYTASAHEGLATSLADNWTLPYLPASTCYPMQQAGGKCKHLQLARCDCMRKSVCCSLPRRSLREGLRLCRHGNRHHKGSQVFVNMSALFNTKQADHEGTRQLAIK